MNSFNASVACTIAFDLRLRLVARGARGAIKMRILGVVVLCAALGGCATKYQEMGFTGGVAAQQITADTWRILSRGNAYTASTTVQDYVLLKAAETTQAAGGGYFQIVSAGDASRASTFVTPGTSTTTVVGNQAFTTSSPGSVDTVIKPGQDVYIRVLKTAPNVPTPGVYSAAEIIQFVGSRVQRPS
jgi:hypothetical protein